MYELNYGYRQLPFGQEHNLQLLFRDNLPKQIKEISKTSKVGFELSNKVHASSSAVFLNPTNQNKSQHSLLGGRRVPRGRLQSPQ